MESWIKEISLEDLDEKNRELAEVIGVETFLALSEIYGGNRIYVNKLDEIVKPIRDRKIKREYNRYNVLELSQKYNLAAESIRRILRDEPLESQLGLFD